MTDKPQTMFDVLETYVDRIKQALHEIEWANRLPDDHARSANSVDIRPSHYNNKDDVTITSAQQLKSLVVADARRRGERERDEKIKRAILEIESHRALLPDAAVRACIDLGAICRAEAERKP